MKDRIKRIETKDRTSNIHTKEKKPSELVWHGDPSFDSRKERMLDKAEKLGCKDAVQVLLAMHWAISGFAEYENVYLDPPPPELKQLRALTETKANDEHKLFNERRRLMEKYGAFDLTKNSARSDWGRLLGIFRWAMSSTEIKPGIFDVKVPGPDNGGDEKWQAFQNACVEKGLNPTGLLRAAESLKAVLHINSAARVEKLKETLDSFTEGKLNQIVSAGYNSGDFLYVSRDNTEDYMTLTEYLATSNPGWQKALYEQALTKAKEAREKFIRDNKFEPQYLVRYENQGKRQLEEDARYDKVQ